MSSASSPVRLRWSLVFAALLPAATAGAACGAATGDAPAAQASQAMLDALVRTNGVPGMGAAVWRDGQVAWTGCAGWRDLEARQPVQADTVFRLASVSKVIAATAAAQLSEQGKLDLDAPVAQILPWLRNDWAPISVRQLAAHTAGLPHYEGDDMRAGERHYANAREAVALFSSRKLRSAPGTEYHYSSWGYTLIGAAIEAASGQHFLDYVAQRVVPGLSIAADTDGRGERVSRLYEIDGRTRRVAEARDFSYSWPGGGLAATPESLVRFGGRLLQGRIVSPPTFAAMLRPARLADGGPVAESDYQLALGWRVSNDADGLRMAHHAGVTAGARSSLVLWPDRQLAAGVLSNALWVASIDKTAMMLAAPFLPVPAGLRAHACPIGVTAYRGRLGDRELQGVVRFRQEHGRCVGELDAAGALTEHFASATAWPNRTLSLIGLDARGDFGRAALVTPHGLYDLRAQGGGRFQAKFSDKLTLQLQF